MTAFTAVLLYAAWTLLLPTIYASIRVPLIASGKKRADAWERGKPVDDPPLLMRMKNAHLNCIENFAVFTQLWNKSSPDPIASYRLESEFYSGPGERLPAMKANSSGSIDLGTFAALKR